MRRWEELQVILDELHRRIVQDPQNADRYVEQTKRQYNITKDEEPLLQHTKKDAVRLTTKL